MMKFTTWTGGGISRVVVVNVLDNNVVASEFKQQLRNNVHFQTGMSLFLFHL